jgi:hypothetical protein
MQHHRYTYESALAASQKVMWRVEDVIGGEKRLDFSKPFMPESLARVEQLTFLDAAERLVLNQIRGHEYLCMFGIVEEFILPFIVDHARPQLNGDDHRVRALLQFAGEEAKHIHLFRRFREEFDAGFGSRCDMIGPAEAIGRAVLAHDPLAVALVILMIEWMTQRHFTDSVKGDGDLDPLFASLLRHHWMEEAQHAKLDTLMVEALAEGRPTWQIALAVDELLEICGFVDRGLEQQSILTVEAFERKTGRELTAEERYVMRSAMHQAARWTYLGSGMVHESFLSTLERLDPAERRRIEADVAPLFG